MYHGADSKMDSAISIYCSLLSNESNDVHIYSYVKMHRSDFLVRKATNVQNSRLTLEKKTFSTFNGLLNLNAEAIPSVFNYFTPRPTKFTAVENRAHFDTVRGEKIQVLLKEEAEAADTQAKAEDTFQNITELISRLPDSILPEKVGKVLQDDKGFFIENGASR